MAVFKQIPNHRQNIYMYLQHLSQNILRYSGPSLKGHSLREWKYIPPTAPDHQTSLTNDQKKNSLITKILIYYEVWTAVFVLHSGHVSRARYNVYSQSPIVQFLHGPKTMHGKCTCTCMYSPSIRVGHPL